MVEPVAYGAVLSLTEGAVVQVVGNQRIDPQPEGGQPG